MSRIKEALAFETYEERLAWFQSLTPEEQVEVAAEIRNLMDMLVRALKPLLDYLAEWARNAMPIIEALAAKIEAMQSSDVQEPS